MSGRVDIAKLHADAKGKWYDILTKCGIDKASLTGKHGPCPICSGGKDRFRFDDKDGKGTFFCNACGAGDGLSLLIKARGWTFMEAVNEVAALVGTAKSIKVKTGRTDSEVRAEMTEMWRSGKHLADIQATTLWWMRRLGEVPASTELRAIRSLRAAGAGDYPAMIARVMGPDGKPASIHRTYLTNDGDKADIPSPRRVMDIDLPKGSAVRLTPVTDVLGVAEGIETAAACQKMFGVPTWALLNAGNMKGFVPPPGVERLVIYGDLDASFTGQASAFVLAQTLWAMREKREPHLRVEVNIHGVVIDPSAWGRDWNDVWQARMHREVAA